VEKWYLLTYFTVYIGPFFCSVLVSNCLCRTSWTMFCCGFPFKLEINENNRCHLGSPCSLVKTWQEKVNIHSGSTPQKTNHTGRERTFKSYTMFTLTCLIFNLSIICLVLLLLCKCNPILLNILHFLCSRVFSPRKLYRDPRSPHMTKGLN